MQQSSTEYPLPQPTEQIVRNRIESFVIFRLNVIPNESANIGVSLKNPYGQTSVVLNLLMQGEAYAAWETDDYLIQWITDQIYLAYPPIDITPRPPIDITPPIVEPEPVLIGE